nr:lipoprotein signal peptidase [Neisseria sp. HSC-16F19]
MGADGAITKVRPLQNLHLRRISALCAARSLAYLLDMSALAALLCLELHPHLEVLQRSQGKV